MPPPFPSITIISFQLPFSDSLGEMRAERLEQAAKFDLACDWGLLPIFYVTVRRILAVGRPITEDSQVLIQAYEPGVADKSCSSGKRGRKCVRRDDDQAVAVVTEAATFCR